MNDRAAIEAMRQALVRTWFPFFARFPRPRDVQLAAYEPLLAGRDAVICSPTASGKTEAVIAPFIERHIPTPGAQPAVGAPRLLVVCPTRALVNDLLRRIEPPLRRLGLRVHRRTGDHAALDRKRPPDLLITTPESLDSMLVRHTRFLSELRAVLLDELHILDGTTRGDQLRILLERLRRVTRRGWGGGPQVVVTSATISVPAALGARYLRDPVQILVPSAPRIETAFAICPRPGDVVGAIDAAYGTDASAGASKILVFTNRRNDVETFAALAGRLGLLGDRVFAHHGSLSREERERVEERFLGAPSGVCFATMTLELGIDIGDVDLVVLVEPPTSVAGFLQRVGRGNRRTGRARVLCCCRDRGDRARFEQLLAAAEGGTLLDPPYAFHPSVVGQQVCSLLMQSRAGWIAPRVVRERLPTDLRAAWSEEALAELMERLERGAWLARGRDRRFVAGAKLARAHRLGTMHANLPHEVDGMEVIDEDTGQVLGQVQAASQDSSIALAGRSRRVLRASEGRLYVSGSSDEADQALFAPRGRQVIPFETARALAASLGLGDTTIPYVESEQGVALFHFAGSLAGELLGQHLKRTHGWPVLRGSAFALLLDEPLIAGPLPTVTAEGLWRAAESLGKKLARLTGEGPFHPFVPDRLRRNFLESVLAVERLAALWNGGQMVRDTKGEAMLILHDLAKVR